jgi:hypothetical protein
VNINRASGKGKRLIVLHAGTRSNGLIDGCDLVFLAKSKDGDYHQEMNSFVFLEWFENQLNFVHNYQVQGHTSFLVLFYFFI